MADLVRIDVHAIQSGALFRGHGAEATRILEEAADDIEREAAEWGENQISRFFHTSFRRPTGYYESHVHISNAGTGLEIGDGGEAGPVYGPWLEGVGSRNVTTRFKGYHTFRKVATLLERRIVVIGDRILQDRARRL